MTDAFYSLPIIAILRGVVASHVKPLSHAFVNAGIRFVEVTMNTEGAPGLISNFNEQANGRFYVGAGTVLNTALLFEALSAGAKFIVMPHCNSDIMKHCTDNGIMVFPGAFTPSEIYRAWTLGATMVKVFPTSMVSPAYFKEIKGPLEQVKLLACGGVNTGNIGDFVKNGADGIAFGGSIVKHSFLEAGNYSQVETEMKLLVEAYRKYA
ncbi:MAG: bifunctional 4-hydroxy-2-oxoglutarate aldolase/2-dehydro-3-deoxy-phosphogluconate aldolase [Bacteroidales bacterium]|nr:bifunctional 4-hydroxy-2-oxoglutarate aldolase/2-dehydro-3-deoxy-phosphogluconate aldolase [Bacteroidales bacterium]